MPRLTSENAEWWRITWFADRAKFATTLEKTAAAAAAFLEVERDGMAAVFVRRSGAFGLGHVGFGYLANRWLFLDCALDGDGPYPYEVIAWDEWIIGGVENLEGTPYTPSGETTAWWAYTHDPAVGLEKTEFPQYDEVKLVEVTQPNPDRSALLVGKAIRDPYWFVSRNCLDAVHDILGAYGVRDLPNPDHIPNWAPSAWFDLLPSRTSPLRRAKHLAKCQMRAYFETHAVGKPDTKKARRSLINVFWDGMVEGFRMPPN